MLENIIKSKNNYNVIVRNITICLISVVFLAITAQISIPLPGGVPLTLQTFSIALIGFSLAENKGIKTILTYLFLGTMGFPVFASGNFGFATLFGLTGGFLLGFIPLVVFCSKAKKAKTVQGKIALSAIALATLHILGILQYGILTGKNFNVVFMLVSLPFLVKDSLSIILAFIISDRIDFIRKTVK